MITRNWSLLAASYLILALGCAARDRDYRFAITGIVTTEDGAPVQDAEVTLQVYGPVYSGVSPVRTEQLKTNSTGGFVIMNISHQAGVKYTITIRKSGFEPQSATGTAPPDAHYKFQLKRIAHADQK